MKLKELLSDVLPLITSFAPTIGASLGGPFGFAAGYLLPILANAFNAHPQDLKQLAANIINDPNAKAKLADLEREHSDWLLKLGDSVVDKLANCEINVRLAWKD